jgi:regulatory protein YycH of two-component signal transduction system YycFG
MASSAVTKKSFCNGLVILISLAFFSVAKTCFVEKFEPQMGSGDDFIKLHVRLQGILTYVTRHCQVMLIPFKIILHNQPMHPYPRP